ncbi:MAG: Grx4 family monothiol glutaredoxin [Candidatus Omnitrophica bacterium]|nr:Grx4 family monothiol glutaredoxin [Candidatus Omnitrophota bacterium]
MDDALKQKIEDTIKSKKVFLFMKGTPEQPMCGFSSQAVNLLQHYKADFATANVLEDADIRQGIQEYADWPTIPQLYVNGEFVGGCDIMTEMHQKGDLEKILSA